MGEDRDVPPFVPKQWAARWGLDSLLGALVLQINYRSALEVCPDISMVFSHSSSIKLDRLKRDCGQAL